MLAEQPLLLQPAPERLKLCRLGSCALERDVSAVELISALTAVNVHRAVADYLLVHLRLVSESPCRACKDHRAHNACTVL